MNVILPSSLTTTNGVVSYLSNEQVGKNKCPRVPVCFACESKKTASTVERVSFYHSAVYGRVLFLNCYTHFAGTNTAGPSEIIKYGPSLCSLISVTIFLCFSLSFAIVQSSIFPSIPNKFAPIDTACWFWLAEAVARSTATACYYCWSLYYDWEKKKRKCSGDVGRKDGDGK